MPRYLNLVAACLVAISLPAAAGAETPPERPGRERPGRERPGRERPAPAISLADAVDITLASDLEIRAARRDVEERRGVLVEESGTFDRRIMIDGSFIIDSQELIGGRLEEEEFRRLRLEIFSDALDRTAAGLIDAVNSEGGQTQLFQQCRADQDRIVIRSPDGTVIILCRSVRATTIEAIGGGLGFRPEILLLLNDDLRARLGDDVAASFFDRFRIISRILRLTASTLRLQRQRLGDTPDEIQFLELDVLLGYQLRWRGGTSFTASVLFNSSEENFAGKPLDPSFGDSPVPNTFTSAAGLQLDLPLGRGRGKVATGAPERAAEADARAAGEILLHTASERALAAVIAYWRLAAAQERRQWIEHSAGVQERILENTRDLVDGDELTRSELARAEARHAEVGAELAAARRDQIAARLELVRAMGLTARGLDNAPLAADGLPDGDRGLGSPEIWIGEAHARRHDLLALAATVRAGDILAAAAKANLRHQVDLSLNASYTSLFESFANRLYEPDGFLSAWRGKIAGPSYGFGLRWVVPVKNNAARGRLAQAESNRARSSILENDLKRTIRLRVFELYGSIERAQQELEHQRQALRRQEEAMASDLELFAAGDLTLIDTLLTEEQLTGARLALADIKRRLAELEAELQFESGQLLVGGGSAEDPDVSQMRLALLSPPEQER